jgi:hypothetical protein
LFRVARDDFRTGRLSLPQPACSSVDHARPLLVRLPFAKLVLARLLLARLLLDRAAGPAAIPH